MLLPLLLVYNHAVIILIRFTRGVTMTEPQRHNAILELLQRQGQISVSDVIGNFDISPATARRDITKLNELGKLRKVRNGAEAVTSPRQNWTPLNIHQTQNLNEKMRIARSE